MSTLYKRHGIWTLSWYCAPGCLRHPTGHSQHCISLRTKDKKLAEDQQKDKDRDLALTQARIALGLHLPPKLTKDWTLKQFVERYELKVLQEQLVPRNTFHRTERWVLDSLVKFRPDASLADLDDHWARDYQAAVKPTVAPATWNSRRAILRAIMNRAMRWGWLAANPFTVLDRAKVLKRRPKRLYREQLPIVLAAQSRFWQLVTLFLYLTGCRLHELCDALRTAVRWQDGYLEIETNKENQPKLVALTPELRTIINEAQDLCKSPYIFSLDGERLPKETVKSAYDRVSATVKFRVSPHRFRHSHGTHVMERGGNLKAIQSTLGHADLRTTAEFYLDVDLDAQRRSMTLLGVDQLLSVPPFMKPSLAGKAKAAKK